MTTKALQANVDKAFIKHYPVAASVTVRQGMPVTLANGAITECDSDDDVYAGVSYVVEGTWPAAAGVRVGIVLRGSPCSVPVLVAAAGATGGSLVAPASAGVTDVTTGGGTAACHVVGMCLETGVEGDLVGCNLGAGCAAVTA